MKGWQIRRQYCVMRLQTPEVQRLFREQILANKNEDTFTGLVYAPWISSTILKRFVFVYLNYWRVLLGNSLVNQQDAINFKAE